MGTPRAILSCVHANLPALQAVLRDIEARGIDRIVSLGDMVGYGSHPRECLALLAKAEISLMGNHEEALLFHGQDVNPKALPSLEGTAAELSSDAYPPEENARLWSILQATTGPVQVGDVMYAHGSPRLPTREYVVPGDANNPEKMAAIFALVKRVCFVGHSHIPHAFLSDGWHASPEACGGELDLLAHPGVKALINVGSVGQPRDGDPRATYVTFNGHVAQFHRVAY